MTTSHPASRVLLLYAAVLAAMLVAAITIAAVRDVPAAKAGEAPAAAQSSSGER